MPKNRQPAGPLEPSYLPAFHGAGWLEHGFHIGDHSHSEGQLVYPASGALATTTVRGTWVAPANRVTWTPPGFDHSHRFYGRTDVRMVVIPAHMCDALAAHPTVFAVSPLLREALLALTEREKRSGAHDHLRAVVIDELVEAPEQDLHLPEARDDRLRAVTAALHADPGQTTTLAELGRAAGASGRTLSRLFQTEFDMSFHRWRTMLRIHHALVHLANGRSVTDTALRCGWSNPTSFIEAFSFIVGQTPGQYLRSNGERNGERNGEAGLHRREAIGWSMSS
ncbi:AraC family transcriptional regulator [Mycolicibacterium palauense]|uniref:AraC family transcriptional regulator n=1 Tax=Mycolicibacterium palauense TaxID=2034511 RepID=UPI000BFEAD0B|nr:helix-turn-helix transcriptional regulator [Mycolicibacterium palauense]